MGNAASGLLERQRKSTEIHIDSLKLIKICVFVTIVLVLYKKRRYIRHLSSIFKRYVRIGKEVEVKERKRIGIQGCNNSCYMDSSLNSMFLFTEAFKVALDLNKAHSPEKLWQTTEYSSKLIEEIDVTLRDKIVSPLTLNKVLDLNTGAIFHFRTLLSKFNPSYLGNEMDPEEFISSLFGQILKIQGFYLIEGDSEGSHVFQTYADMTQPTHEIDVQALLEHSFYDSDIKLADIPKPGFILKMPVTDGRHMFEKIHPNQIINLKNILERGEDKKMLLSAVICLSGNHFTSFVREGDAGNSEWWYLDSFSDQRPQRLPNFEKDLENYSHEDPLISFLYSTCYMCFYLPIQTARYSETDSAQYVV